MQHSIMQHPIIQQANDSHFRRTGICILLAASAASLIPECLKMLTEGTDEEVILRVLFTAAVASLMLPIVKGMLARRQQAK